MRTILLLSVALALSSCAIVPTPMVGQDGRSSNAMLLAGKGMLTYNADGSMAYTYQQEKSWQHAMQAVTTLGLGLFDMKVRLAKEITERFLAGQITIQQRDALFFALANAQTQADLTLGLANLGFFPTQ